VTLYVGDSQRSTHGLPRLDKLPQEVHGTSRKKDGVVVFLVSYGIIVNVFDEGDIVGMQCAEFTEAEDVDEFMAEDLEVDRAKRR
jgi:hypothetical protein